MLVEVVVVVVEVDWVVEDEELVERVVEVEVVVVEVL